jgi:hypothetical protein
MLDAAAPSEILSAQVLLAYVPRVLIAYRAAYTLAQLRIPTSICALCVLLAYRAAYTLEQLRIPTSICALCVLLAYRAAYTLEQLRIPTIRQSSYVYLLALRIPTSICVLLAYVSSCYYICVFVLAVLQTCPHTVDVYTYADVYCRCVYICRCIL